jgi:hypothetical protein
MSGVKWDRDLGRKFESGASNIKIKAELERKNLELSGSLSNIFKNKLHASITKIKVKIKVGSRWKTLHESGELVLER